MSNTFEYLDNPNPPSGKKLAIIVPFRDNPKQNRAEHLRKFVPYMEEFLDDNDFHVFVIEQSNDGRKFNRGKLLNVGFIIAKQKGYDYVIFHDVDLLPQEDLLGYYLMWPEKPIHIAYVWDKYEYEHFFGGVTGFSNQDFIDVNGFPNNFWGWGGEDDELFKRVKKVGLNIWRPREGTFEEMKHGWEASEGMSKEEKKTHKRAHKKTWRKNGLRNLRFKKLGKERLGEHGSKYTVRL